MAANAIQIVALICALLSFILLMVAVIEKHWVDLGQSYSGLWDICFSSLIGTTCIGYGGDVSDHIHVTRAFLILAIICSIIALIAIGASFFRTQAGNYPLAKISAVANLVAAIFTLISAATFTAIEVPNQFFGWTFGIAWACLPLCLISVTLILDH